MHRSKANEPRRRRRRANRLQEFKDRSYAVPGGKPTFIVHFPGVWGPFSSTGDLIPLVQISRLNRLTYSGILHAEDQAMGRACEGNARLSALRARGPGTTARAESTGIRGIALKGASRVEFPGHRPYMYSSYRHGPWM